MSGHSAVLVGGLLLAQASMAGDVADHVWRHGSADCADDRGPAIEVFEFDRDSYILRQNKCVHFEAPFVYVLFGQHTVFVQDTGATVERERFPLYDTVQALIARHDRSIRRVLVAHSHGHGDHIAADAQFRGQPGVSLIEPDLQAVRTQFGLTQWPEGLATLDLGQRRLDIIPAPGHHEQGIAVYDGRSGWLLTGDTLYPGRVLVKDWNAYRASIGRLAAFSETHTVSAVLGSHIEISRDGRLFDVGSRHQPGEASLVMPVETLRQLDDRLRAAGDRAQEIVMDSFVVAPLGALQKALGAALKWLGVRG